MCGIAGYISKTPGYLPNRLATAARLMQHRGPDAGAVYIATGEQAGLAHRRLSIIDLSETANQPMTSACGRYSIVFNGEIYNYQELRRELPCKGQNLRTQGDTEVILELFVHFGTRFFPQLNGMFAFAIYDSKEQVLTLCRDHIGIKPLFVYAQEDTLIFASELKVIRSLIPNIKINAEAIPAFLHLGFIPEPSTIYQQVYKFPAGHWVQIPVTHTSYTTALQEAVAYWNPADAIQPQPIRNQEQALDQLEALLSDAVGKQLVSDVPIGTFLSGGIDSSLVTALAARHRGVRGLNTFSISISEGKYNEGSYARAVARHLGTQHHEFNVHEKEVIELIDRFLPAYDEPFADSSAFPTMMVSRLARKEVTVALSGDGGDELFHGYGAYRWANRLSNPFLKGLRKPIYAFSQLSSNRIRRAGHLFDYPSGMPAYSHIFSQEQYYFKWQELSLLLKNPAGNPANWNQPVSASRKLTPAEQQSVWDIGHYLKDDLLVKVDRASMQFSLESRVPLLDYRVVEWALNLAPEYKMAGENQKFLLKELLFRFVPRTLFDRPKWGFSIPLEKWLQTDLNYLVQRYLSSEVLEKHQIVNVHAVQQLQDRYKKGQGYLFNRIWLLLVLHWWLEEQTSVLATY